MITLTEGDGVVLNEIFIGEFGTDQMTPNGTEMKMDTTFSESVHAV